MHIRTCKAVTGLRLDPTFVTLEPSVTPDATGIVVPAGKLTQAQRTAVLAHKSDLIAYLLESSRITTQSLESAMRRCDQFNDGEKARRDMLDPILETPPHLRRELLDYFMRQVSGPPSALKEQRENNHD